VHAPRLGEDPAGRFEVEHDEVLEESFKAAGQEVAGVVYGGRSAEGEGVLVKAYLALKGKRAVVFFVVGKESRDREYGGQVRKMLESLTLK
jgi:hypothetical protein